MFFALGSRGASLLALSLLAVLGCNAGGPAKVPKASVDADAVVARGMKLYDANSDGAIDKSEAAKCPALGVAFAEFDADHDSKVARDELLAVIKGIVNSGTSVASLQCQVNYAGRPLEGATVKLVPDQMYGGALLTAQATTDATGLARPTIGDENIPAKLAGSPLLYPGLYRVEITHPKTELAAKYNTATELGAAIIPASRNSGTATFDLK